MERLQRSESTRMDDYSDDPYEYARSDEKLAKKIWGLLGSRHDIFWENCDALYFDYSVIPHHLKISGDAYFIFGITNNAEFVSMWVGRYELDK